MSGIELLIIIAVSGILLFFIWVSLASVSLFGKFGDFLIAVCVTIICIISMFDFTPPELTPQLIPESTVTISKPAVEPAPIKQSEPSAVKLDKPQKHRFFLLPYEALGVTILAGLLIWLLLRLRQSKLFTLAPSKNKAAGSSTKEENLPVTKGKKAKSEKDHFEADLKILTWSFDDRTKR